MHVAFGHRRVTGGGGGGILQLIMTPILQNAALQVARARLGHPPGSPATISGNSSISTSKSMGKSNALSEGKSKP
jgi:hypothetical protein